jgi:glycosyltransferase involved in cell wall biosynthesis
MGSQLYDDIAVDVVVTNHNYGDFVTDAIDSALHQTHPNVHVVVVDDGSTDDSRERLLAYKDEVELILKANGGQASAINAAMERCRGDVVILLDADDLIKPQLADRVAKTFATDLGVARVQFWMEIIDAEGQPTGGVKPRPRTRMPNGDLRAAELAFPFDLTWMATSGNAFRADALRRIIPIPERDYPRCGADWYVIHLVSLLGRVVSLEEIGASYRVHGRNSYEQRAPQLDLEHVRNTINYSRATAEALAALADELALRRPDPIRSVSEVGNRLISHKLEPALHPIAADTASSLLAEGISATRRRFDLSWSTKAMFVMWFITTALAPLPITRRLAELFLFRDRRRRLTSLLSRVQGDPACAIKSENPSA